MRTPLFAFSILLSLLAAPIQAGDIVKLGVGRLFSNDALGDFQDRWHSGAYVLSAMIGPDGTESLPEKPGELFEFRFSSRILAPANTVTPKPWDRRYAGIAAVGAYTYFSNSGFDFNLGAEAVFVGPATQVSAFHSFAHKLLGQTPPSALVTGGQFGNKLYGAVAGEFAWPHKIGDDIVIRPYVQGRYGDETYLRAGADFLFGANFITGIVARDETTGMLYQTLKDRPGSGWSFLVGADTAKVFSSVYLPASAGFTLTPMRNRVRAGVHFDGDIFGVFYGATYLGREFAAQPEGQIVGSVQLQVSF